MELHLALFWFFLFSVQLEQPKIDFSNKNYYDILEVSSTATNKEIRNSYKKLAKKLHPDRIGNTPEALDNFMKLTKAYEVLMNSKLREKYDRDGRLDLEEDEENEQSSNIFSGLFLKNTAYIVTLRGGTFDHSVLYSGDIWLVNFYSSYCQHCIDFAETYLTIGIKYKNVIHIGAFNCLNDQYVCNKENVNQYPTLKIYPSENKYSGDFSLESIYQFIQSNTGSFVTRLTNENFTKFFMTDKDSIIIFPKNDLDKDDVIRANMLGLAMISINVRVYLSKCGLKTFIPCENVNKNSDYSLLYLPSDKLDDETFYKWFYTLDTQSLINFITQQKEPIQLANNEWIMKMEWESHEKTEEHLILFTNSKDLKKNYLKYMKLKYLVGDEISLVFLDCESTDFCKRVYLKDIPVLIYLNNNGMQVHHGNLIAGEIVSFYKAASTSNVVSLYPMHPMWEAAVTRTLKNSLVYLYNSHCQPCVKKIWEFRRLWSLLPYKKPSLYSIDCSIFSDSCSYVGVSYGFPCIKLFNDTVEEITNYFTIAEDMIEFIKDSNKVYVDSISPEDMEEKVFKRGKGEIWFLDFYDPRCMPCIEIFPILKKLAKKHKGVKFAKIDCVQHSNYCLKQNVEHYPTLRLYSLNSAPYIKYNSWYDYNLLDQFLLEHTPGSAHTITSSNYQKVVKNDSTANWVIDLYASWCGPCKNFMPIFEKLAEEMNSNTLKFGKIDCAVEKSLCNNLGAQYYPFLVIIPPYYKSDVKQVDSSVWNINHISSDIKRLMVTVDSDL